MRKTIIPILMLLIIVSLNSGCLTGGSTSGGIVIDRPALTFTSEIKGIVFYRGTGIPDVEVRVEQFNISTVTDEEGIFRFEIETVMPVGVKKIRLQVKLSKEGYRPRTSGIYVSLDRPREHRILLLPLRTKEK